MSDQVGRADFSRLYRTVLDELCSGRYRAGQRLGIKEISGRLRVSTTPIREVMSRLVGRGIVDERRSEGYYLARLEVRDVADLYGLHARCTDLAIRELTWPPQPAEGPFDNGWSLLSYLVDQVGNRILYDARTYLDDRLRVIRHFEDSCVGNTVAEAANLASLCAYPNSNMLRRSVAKFYKRRIAVAPALVLMAGRS